MRSSYRAWATATILASFLGASKAVPTTIPPTSSKRDLKFPFGATKIRGVNLGGWLVLEPWITPSLFEATPDNVVDEFTFGQTLGSGEASARLGQHWSSWITSSDFNEIASKGLNFVRIPIGYWSVVPLQGDPYVQGAYEYLGKALDWAQSAGLKVMIDLHGAPGSQNGFDNSGKRGGVGWTQGDTVAQTLAALTKISNDYANHPAVGAIELLNEPMGPNLNMDTVKQFMVDGHNAVQSSNVAVGFHDAFLGIAAWNDWGAGLNSLVLDTHHYEVFDAGQLQMDAAQHVSSACDFGRQMASINKWTIAGEFTGAMTDCAKWLNGRGNGARYDGTFNYNGQTSSYIGSCDGRVTNTVDGMSPSDKTNVKNFIEAQLVAYEKAAGWIFWAWKTESAPEWSFRDLTNAGLINLASLNTAICG